MALLAETEQPVLTIHSPFKLSYMRSARKKLTTDTLIQYKDRYYTGTDIKAMREWIADCEWPDLSAKEIKSLSPIQVLMGVRKHFGGGLSAFLATMQ